MERECRKFLQNVTILTKRAHECDVFIALGCVMAMPDKTMSTRPDSGPEEAWQMAL